MHRGCTLPAFGGYPQENTHGALFFKYHKNPASVPAVRAKSTLSSTLSAARLDATLSPSDGQAVQLSRIQECSTWRHPTTVIDARAISFSQAIKEHGTKCQIDPSANASASPRCFSACARKTGRPVHAKQEATTWFGAASTPSWT